MNLAAGMSQSSNINANYSQILKLQNDLRPKGLTICSRNLSPKIMTGS
jgi:hypothetical protein